MTPAQAAIRAQTGAPGGYEALPYARRGLAYRLFLLSAAAVWWALGAPFRRGWVVLCYHGVSDRQAPGFARQVRMLRRGAGDLAELDSADPRGVRVALTFDDAFENLLRNALSVLREQAIPATVFLVTDNMGATPRWDMPPGHPERDEPVMTRDQLAGLVAGGFHRVASHTHTHRPLATLDEAEIEAELRRSVEVLAGLGVTAQKYMAAPHGSWDDRVQRVCESLGLRILTLEPGLCRPGCARIARFSATPDMWPLEFRLLVRGGYAFLPAVRGLARALRGRTADSPARLDRESQGRTGP